MTNDADSTVTCQCDDNYLGDRCNTVGLCDPNDRRAYCNGNGECATGSDGSVTCNCDDNYTGDLCNIREGMARSVYANARCLHISL